MKAIDYKHFDIPEPLLIGMSGGQTSAMQLRLFLDALGGKIHDGVGGGVVGGVGGGVVGG